MRLALSAAVVAQLVGGCSQTSPPRADGSSGAIDTSVALPAGSCRFAHVGNPSSADGGEDVINAPLERLEAQPGGLWWIRGSFPQGEAPVRIQAQGRCALPLAGRRIGLADESPGTLIAHTGF